MDTTLRMCILIHISFEIYRFVLYLQEQVELFVNGYQHFYGIYLKHLYSC